jgi:hypothetical protein
MMLGVIQSIEEVSKLKICGLSDMSGYKVSTDQHTFYVLIEEFPTCCEDYGYFSAEDNLSYYIGSELREVTLTDTARKTMTIEDENYFKDSIQFVDFMTTQGVFQIAVYNVDENGNYGHTILLAKDEEIVDTL